MGTVEAGKTSNLGKLDTYIELIITDYKFEHRYI